MNSNKNITKNINGARGPIDVYFDQYKQKYQTAAERWLLVALLILFYFGVMGVCWIMPFPYIKFMGSYNGYFNCASFLIAILMYYWIKKIPVASYLLLFFLFGLTYAISQVQLSLASNMWIVYAAAIIAPGVILLSGFQKRHIKAPRALILLPLWLAHLPLKRQEAKN